VEINILSRIILLYWKEKCSCYNYCISTSLYD